jgi:hypothetical protein
MDKRLNPFNELYVSESVTSSAFVQIFSPYILKNASALFLPGNVVVKGIQGCGKSMLLSLLKPEVRLAYGKAGQEFPVSGKLAKFIGAGINLTRSGAIDFGQRQIEKQGDETELLPIYFGDFLNYWIVYDILSTIDLYGSEDNSQIAGALGLAVTEAKLQEFAASLRQSRAWFGYLKGVKNYSQLRERLETRINAYLSFLNFNVDVLPDEIRSSKTTVGEPISQTAEHLRACGLLAEDVHVFVRIDQYEELIRLEGKRKEYASLFREVVNKALSLRNPNVSYRVGTRGYAWEEHPRVYGTTGNLERDRNFKLVDLDEILRRRENRKTWIFPSFAEDVFKKRLQFAGYDVGKMKSPLLKVFGAGMSPEDKARKYCGKAASRLLRLDESWPETWKEYLTNLALEDPLSARLGEAWAKQRLKRSIVQNVPKNRPPWQEEKHKYWRKERIQAALMQIAGRCAQRMIWAGVNDITELSGGNILVFVSLCQHIWAAWLRSQRETMASDNSLPSIEDSLQAVGTHEASTHWYNKLPEEIGGNTRQRFVTIVANALERTLYNDESLSYPGRNGFSLVQSELDRDQDLKTFLNDCVDYGGLVDSPHTTKESSRKPRRKWYLTAVLSPYFKLPHIHTKEPLYTEATQVRRWLNAARAASSEDVSEAKPSKLNQPSLFVEEPK